MSLKMQEEYGDSLNVLLVDVSRDTAPAVQKFALKRNWLGGRTIWTKERPFSSGLPYIPAAVLLSSEGKVLYVGNPIEGHKQLEGLIEDDLAARSKGPADAPKDVSKLYAEFAKGNWAKAFAGAQALVDKPPARDGEAVAAAATAALASFNAQVDARLAKVDTLIAAGVFDRASELVASMAKSAKGQADLAGRVDALSAKLKSDDLKAERDAADALAKLEKKLYDKGPDDGVAKALKGLAEKHPGTRAAERAVALADVAAED